MRKTDVEALAGIALFYVVLEALGVTCPILYLTGISCAGCGMSRAWLCLAQLDIAGAFAYHPLFWLPPVVLAALVLRRRMPERVLRGILAVCGLLFIGVYLIRLLSPGDVVVWEPAQGLFGRLIRDALARIK